MIFVLGLCVFISCSPTDQDIDIDLIDQLFLIGEAHALNRYIIDWDDAKTKVRDAERTGGKEGAISEYLGILGDNHSVYISSVSESIRNSSISCDAAGYNINLSDPSIGYLKVTEFSGSGIGEEDYAEAIQEAMAAQDHEEIKGWVVDISNNKGGNMYPMIASIGPLLGNGEYGFFVTPDDIATPWGYNDGRAYLNSTFNALTDIINPYTLINPDPKIAIVMDNQTASAGEAVVISFLNRANVRTFGQETCGLSTANTGFPLIDGGRLFITSSTMADRNRMVFGSSIVPDEMASSNEELEEKIKTYFDE